MPARAWRFKSSLRHSPHRLRVCAFREDAARPLSVDKALACAANLTACELSFILPGMNMASVETRQFRTNLRPLVDGRIESVAAAAGISRVYLSKILNGHCTPSLDVASDLARAVGVSLGSLTGSVEVRATA